MRASAKRGRPVSGPDAPNWWFAHLMDNTVAKFLRFIFRVRIVGAEKVPATGAVIAANHVSNVDPVLLWCATPRPVHFMAKAEIWKIGILGWASDEVYAFPVHRGGADREAITMATKLLQAGDLVGVFPEGTRQKQGEQDLGEGQGGAAFLALRANVPVVPVGIVGTERVLPRGKFFPRFKPVTFVFGDPVRPDDFEGSRKDKVAAMTTEVMSQIDRLRRADAEA